jgi:hypothetical protein
MENTIEKNIKIRKNIDESYAAKGMDYDEYRRLINAFIIIGKSTAKKDSENLLEYSKLNVARMNRLDKTIEIIPELEKQLNRSSLLKHGWCLQKAGAAMQRKLPVFDKIAQLNSNIELKFF